MRWPFLARPQAQQTVPAFGDGFDVLRAVRSHTKRFSQDGNVGGEGAFLHDGIRPHSLEQLVFCNWTALRLYEQSEDLDSFGRQGQTLAIPK